MGAWGPGLYADDVPCEIREEFKRYLEKGLSHAGAAKQILRGYGSSLRSAARSPRSSPSASSSTRSTASATNTSCSYAGRVPSSLFTLGWMNQTPMGKNQNRKNAPL